MNLVDLCNRIEWFSARDRDKLARHITEHFHHLEHRMTQLDDAIASASAKLAALNTKVDAALAALAASVANQTPVTQAELDAIKAMGDSADAEGAKVDAALAPPPAPTGGGGPGEEHPAT